MKIGNDEISGYCALAPMAGVADAAFRELCSSFGAAFHVSEMVSAKALTMNDQKSRELMRIGEAERPCGIQLFGSIPGIMAEGARIAMEYHPDFIDINMGCPAPKIVKNNCGSALLNDLPLAGRIVKAVKTAVSIPVSVKFRIGWDKEHINCIETAKILADNGADFITVHGRTRAQMYAPPADLASIRAVKQAVSIPVIGNGDIFSAEDAMRMYQETGCDFIMAGRGTMGNPWLFSEINALFSVGTRLPGPTPEEKMRVMLCHAARICELKGERIGMNEVRKHALWYTKGLRGSAKLRNEFSTVKDFDQLRKLAQLVISGAEESQFLKKND